MPLFIHTSVGGGLILKIANTDIHYCQSEQGGPTSFHVRLRNS